MTFIGVKHPPHSGIRRCLIPAVRYCSPNPSEQRFDDTRHATGIHATDNNAVKRTAAANAGAWMCDVADAAAAAYGER